MKVLGLITARGGSKGLPGKNIKELGGKPLIAWTIEAGQESEGIDELVVSTDDKDIIEVSKKYGANVPFVRPQELASDYASSISVVLHAIKFYSDHGQNFDYIVLLQPTSPFRKKGDIDLMLQKAYSNPDADMVVSVLKSDLNPYYNLFKENELGGLEKCISSEATRRQDVPDVYAYNGSVYVIKVSSLLEQQDLQFSNVLKFEMDQEYSIDIDNQYDLDLATFMCNRNK